MEQSIDKDSRPFFSKPQGEVGIYIDFMDVTPQNKDEYGSPQYMRMDFLDKLYTELAKVPTVKVKGALERKGIMDGTIIETWNKGVVLAVSFDSQNALDRAWKDYEDGKVAPAIVNGLKTPELLRAMGASKMQMRARMWRDELDACKLEMENIRLKAFTLKDKDNDQTMMRSVRAFQANQLESLTQELKDHHTLMDQAFSNITITMKKNIPIKLLKISTYQQFLAQLKEIQSSKKIQMKPFDVYMNMRKRLWDAIDTVEENILHPLSQVHVQCESENQQDLKHKMKTECSRSKERLTDDYDWSHLKHPEWQKKILNREHDLFLGLASVIGAGMDTLLEIDIQCDEYMSGVEGVKISAIKN